MTERDLRDAMNVHGNTVYRLALCRLQNLQDAEDVYQDVFLRLLGQETEAWDAERTKAWLIRTTLNRCADLHRFRARRPVLPLAEFADCAAIAEREPTDSISAAELWAAVAKLPPKLRTVIHLYYAEGYSTEELTAMLNVPAATVRTRLHRGRERLKRLLGGFDDEA